MRNQKPQISYDRAHDRFLKEGQPISDAKAKAHWFAADADWTQAAYHAMAQRMMS